MKKTVNKNFIVMHVYVQLLSLKLVLIFFQSQTQNNKYELHYVTEMFSLER